jgi:hypothetical protein
MALVAAPLPIRTLSQMRNDADALVADFINAYAAELPPKLATICIVARDLFLKKHLRTRLGSMFRLTLKQAEEVLVEAGADQGDVAGWCASFEDAAGFEFREHNVPVSSHLATSAGVVAGSRGPIATRVPPSGRHRTIGQELNEAQEAYVLPECCYDKIDTDDPMTNTIREPELEAFSDAVMEALGTRFGRYNLGMPLCRMLGKQVAKRLPHIPLGKGKDRSWGSIFNPFPSLVPRSGTRIPAPG